MTLRHRLAILPTTALVLAALAAVAEPWVRSPWGTAAAWCILVGAVVATAWRLASRLLPDAAPSVFLVATALVFEALASVVVAVPGSVGSFRLPVVAALVGTAGWLAHVLAPVARRPAELLDTVLQRRFTPLPVLAVALLGAVCALAAVNQLRFTVQDADSMWYHLPMAGEWVRTGSIAPFEAIPLIGRAYPGFRQSVLAFLSLPAGNEHLALLGILELPLLAAAVYATARAFGARRHLALAAGTYVAATPVVVGAYSTHGNDLAVAIQLLLSVLFTGRAFADRSGTGHPIASPGSASGDAVLAGLALGGLAATKFSGPAYALVIVLALGAQHGVRRALQPATAGPLLGGLLLLAGPWYLRNLLCFGNPMYPARIAVAGHVVFPGPLGPDYFAPTTMGFACGPLFAKVDQFSEAHGPLVLLGAAGPLLALFGALGRTGVRSVLAIAALPIVLFVAFLHHPFNLPGFDASYVHRYLVAWFALSATAAAIGLSRWPRVAMAAAGLLLIGAASTGLATTHAAPLLLAAVATSVAALCLPRLRGVLLPLARRALQWPLPFAAAVLLAVPAAWLLERHRAAAQYDPDYGWHDAASDRGWGPAMAWAHRQLHGARIGLHGSIYFFPLLGEPFRNEVLVADDLHLDLPRRSAAEVADWAEAQRLDWLVCCVPRTGRTGSRDYDFGESIAAELLAAHPAQFRVAFTAQGTQVLQVLRR